MDLVFSLGVSSKSEQPVLLQYLVNVIFFPFVVKLLLPCEEVAQLDVRCDSGLSYLWSDRHSTCVAKLTLICV